MSVESAAGRDGFMQCTQAPCSCYKIGAESAAGGDGFIQCMQMPCSRYKMDDQMTAERQRGALYIEATLSLSFFMFAIFTLLSVIQISYTQARMAAALDSAAKEIAEYAHVYYASGMGGTYGGTDGKSSKIFNALSEYLEKLGGNVGMLNSDLGKFITGVGGALKGDSISQWLQSEAGMWLTLKLVEKNMVSRAGDSAEAFKKRNHITEMNMDGSKFLEGGGNEVFMQIHYVVRVVRLLNIDIEFHMSHCAYARAWK